MYKNVIRLEYGTFYLNSRSNTELFPTFVTCAQPIGARHGFCTSFTLQRFLIELNRED